MAGRRASNPRPVALVQTPDADPQTQRAFDVLTTAVRKLQARTHAPVLTGTGSPEGVVEAPVGTLYTDINGGANTTLYVKESSPTPSTGWIAK